MTLAEQHRSDIIHGAEQAVSLCTRALQQTDDEFVKFQLMWDLAFVQLRHLEDLRMAGGERWPKD